MLSEVQQDFSKYQKIKSSLRMPLKTKLYFNLLEHSLTVGQKEKFSKQHYGFSDDFIRVFLQLSNKEKEKILLVNICALYKEFQDIAIIDEIQQNSKESFNEISDKYLKEPSQTKIEGFGQMQTFVLGLPYWQKIKFELNSKNHQLAIHTENKKIIDLRQYLVRLSTKNPSTLVLQLICHNNSLKICEKLYLAFQQDSFSQVYDLLFYSITNYRNQKLIQEFSLGDKNNEFVHKSKDVESQAQSDISGIGLSVRPLVFLNSKNINKYLNQKEQINQKLRTLIPSFLPIFSSSHCTISKSSIDKTFYKVESVFDNLKAIDLKGKFLEGLNKQYSYVKEYQVLEKYTSKYHAIYQKINLGKRNYDQIIIKQDNSESPELGQFMFFKSFHSFGSQSFMNFTYFEVMEQQPGKSKLIIYGQFEALLIGGVEQLVYLLEAYPKTITESFSPISPVSANHTPLKKISSMEEDFHTVLDEFQADASERPFKILQVTKEIKRDTSSVENKDSVFEKIMPSPSTNPFMKKAQPQEVEAEKQVPPQKKYLFYRYQQEVLPKQQVQEKFQPSNWLTSEWKRAKAGKVVCHNAERLEEQRKVYKKLIKSLGEQIFKKGNIMNISLPVDLFSKQSHLTSVAKTFCFTPYLVEKGMSQEDWVSSLTYFSGLPMCMNCLGLSLEKPFNPILGQTVQYTVNGCPLYLEQTSHHPPITSYLFIGRGYRISGTIVMKLDIGLNQVKGYSDIPHTLQLDNGTEIQFNHPGLAIGGLLIGERTFNFEGKHFLYDKNNNYFADIFFGQTKKTYFASQTYPQDEVTGKIHKVKPEFREYYEKNKRKLEFDKKFIEREVCSDLKGVWNIGYKANERQIITITGENQNLPFQLEESDYVLPSDARYREDLQLFKEGNSKKAQQKKVEMEELQRADKKLRQKYSKK